MEEKDEEQKDEEKTEAQEDQLTFDNLTEWIKSTQVMNEDEEKVELTLSDTFKALIGEISGGGDIKFVTEELPSFLDKLI